MRIDPEGSAQQVPTFIQALTKEFMLQLAANPSAQSAYIPADLARRAEELAKACLNKINEDYEETKSP